MQMWCLAVYMLLCSLCVADLIVGMEELELHYRRRGRYNFRKIKIATISVRMVSGSMQKHTGCVVTRNILPLDWSVAIILLKYLVPTYCKQGNFFHFGARGFEKHKKDQNGAENVVPFWGVIFTIKLGKKQPFLSKFVATDQSRANSLVRINIKSTTSQIHSLYKLRMESRQRLSGPMSCDTSTLLLRYPISRDTF